VDYYSSEHKILQIFYKSKADSSNVVALPKKPRASKINTWKKLKTCRVCQTKNNSPFHSFTDLLPQITDKLIKNP
jgi:hypothetical protein